MMYLVAKVCSENNHLSCGCLAHSAKSQFSESNSSSTARMAKIFNQDYKGLRQENQFRSSHELSHSDISKLNAGSPLRLIKSVEQRQGKILGTYNLGNYSKELVTNLNFFNGAGCKINSAFANAFTKVFIDHEDIRNLNKASKILNGDPSPSHSTSNSKIWRILDTDDKELAHIRWTKSAINLHNNQIGRKVRSQFIQISSKQFSASY